jgi:SAM-dependent methyltransferase
MQDDRSMDRNPQGEQMADESMVRGLAAQAEAIWPQESVFFSGYSLPDAPRILDIGCGTGEITGRLARLFPAATLVGVDIIDAHLELARQRHAELAERLSFTRGDAFHLAYEANRFDLVVCRHMLQSVPDAEQVLAEMVRVARPGGRLHVLSEDYAMMHFDTPGLDADVFWHEGPVAFGNTTGTDLRFGRRTWPALRRLGMQKLEVRYVVVDTVRVAREAFRDIWVAWRDGYTDVLTRKTNLSREEVAAYWQAMIDCLERPDGYAVWQVPVITGVKSGG